MRSENLISKSNYFRIKILDIIRNSGKGHIGGAYSCIDILTVLYYGNILKMDPGSLSDKSRNRFLMSKGHAGIAQYVILQDLGFFSEKELLSMNKGGLLGEHPDHNIPGIEFDTGSLGHGLGVAAGFAYASKLDEENNKIYVLLGDGECYEGAVWEAALLAAHLKLDNLIAIVDRNGLCIHGETEEINKLEPMADKWRAFGWNVVEVDGHNHEKILNTFHNISSHSPTVLIANTVKGKGVSYMENEPQWHHGGISDDLYNKAYDELVN